VVANRLSESGFGDPELVLTSGQLASIAAKKLTSRRGSDAVIVVLDSLIQAKPSQPRLD
jgi:hypothetical protein